MRERKKNRKYVAVEWDSSDDGVLTDVESESESESEDGD
jgi:hypothetical protein